MFDTFPWPQAPSLSNIKRVAEGARLLRALRRRRMDEERLSLRELYQLIELPGQNPLKSAQDELDAAVRAAFGMSPKRDPLDFLLALNFELAALEVAGGRVQAPGLPAGIKIPAEFMSADRMEIQPRGAE